jgi:hypothetical protein
VTSVEHDDLCRYLPAVGIFDRDEPRIADDMVVGGNETCIADEEPGARSRVGVDLHHARIDRRVHRRVVVSDALLRDDWRCGGHQRDEDDLERLDHSTLLSRDGLARELERAVRRLPGSNGSWRQVRRMRLPKRGRRIFPLAAIGVRILLTRELRAV